MASKASRRWLTRAKEYLIKWGILTCSFEINVDNMEDLARLSDKYDIPSLYTDVGVPACCCTQLTYQKSAHIMISRKKVPTLQDWEFAARHSFDELKQYCLGFEAVTQSLRYILKGPTGVSTLMNRRLSPETIDRIVANMIKEEEFDRPERCVRCRKGTRIIVKLCDSCKTKLTEEWEGPGKAIH